MATGGNQRYGADTIVHQFLSQFAAGHPRITDSKVEAIGYGITKVIVIYQMKTVAQKNLF